MVKKKEVYTINDVLDYTLCFITIYVLCVAIYYYNMGWVK